MIKELLTALEEMKEIEDSARLYAQIMHRESLDNTGNRQGACHSPCQDGLGERDEVHLRDRPEGDRLPLARRQAPSGTCLLNIVPTDQSTKYLYLVGMMAWIFTDDERRKSIDAAKTRPAVFALLKKYSDLYFAGLTVRNRPGADPSDNLSNVPGINLDLLIRLDRLNQLQEEGDKSETVTNKINDLRKIIDRKSLAYYEKMRSRSLNPFAILDRNSCSGCHMDLAPYYLAQVRESKNIAVCNHCGRFLIVI